MLGFLSFKLTREKIISYISAYPKVMAPGAILFLKHDMANPKDQPKWAIIKYELLKHFTPLRRYIQVTKGCVNQLTLQRILRVDGGRAAVYLNGTTINDTAVPLTLALKYRRPCDAYLHTQWVLKS